MGEDWDRCSKDGQVGSGLGMAHHHEHTYLGFTHSQSKGHSDSFQQNITKLTMAQELLGKRKHMFDSVKARRSANAALFVECAWWERLVTTWTIRQGKCSRMIRRRIDIRLILINFRPALWLLACSGLWRSPQTLIPSYCRSWWMGVPFAHFARLI